MNPNIENILNIKTNFKLCERCGNQLHHGIRICERCGKDNGVNNGSTIGGILYVSQHRTLKYKPLDITPELIYDAYKDRLKVSKEEFLNYVKNVETVKVNRTVKNFGSYKVNKTPIEWRYAMGEKFITKFKYYTK